MGCGCCCVTLLSVSVLAMSGTLLGVGVSRLADTEALAVARLDGGQCIWADFCVSSDVWTGVFGGAGLLLLLLSLLSCQYMVLLPGLLLLLLILLSCQSKLLLAGMLLLLALFFVAARLDDITGEPAGGKLDHVTATMNASLEQYRNKSSIARDWDHVQRALRCCGPSGAADWAPVLGNDTVPDSCCERAAAANCSAAEGSFSTGCAPAVQALVAGQRRWSVALATVTASLLLLITVTLCSAASGDSHADTSTTEPLIAGHTQADLDNHANQLNPNNWRFKPRLRGYRGTY